MDINIGTIALQLIYEVQPRYHMEVMPFVVILGSSLLIEFINISKQDLTIHQ